MNAAYRLMGNFPSRGFGDSLSSADFNSGAAIVSGKDARLPMSGAPRVRTPQAPGEVTEAYHAYEIHPLSYGQLTVMYSATGSMMQVNGAATRPCTYTNAVTWTGDGVPAYVSADEAMCGMLRYNDFVTLQELWVLPKDVSSLPPKPWVEDASVKLDYAPMAPVSDEMLRSLLANYWRTASLQFFGPWDSGKRMACLYQDDLLMSHVSNRDRTFTVCISREDDCHTLVPQAKGFLWQMILRNLPAQIRNITSVAAAVPMQHALSLYRDAAMCVVYPTAEATFDFNTGKFPSLEADEDRFMQQVLKGNQGALLRQMHTRFAALTGKMLLDECTFMADFDLALALYRIENAADDWTLLSNWYAAHRHLGLRHEIQGDLAARVMQDVDEYVTSRLRGHEVEVAQMLTSQKDRLNGLKAAGLQSFLWEKATYSAGSYCEVPARITVACQGMEGAVFFTELPAAKAVPENEVAVQRMAGLLSSVLNTHHLNGRLTDQQIKLIKVRGQESYRTCKPLHDAMAMYLAAYQNRHPEDRIRLLDLATQYLDADEQAAEALKMLANRLEQPVTTQESEAISSLWARLKHPAVVMDELNNYIAALYVRYFDDLSVVSQSVSKLGANITGAMVKVFSQEPGCSLRLNAGNFASILGQDDKVDCLLTAVRDLAQVEPAYRAYLMHQLKQSVHTGESLYTWIVEMINRSLHTRLYHGPEAKGQFLAWCTELVMDYTLNFALTAKRLPEKEAFGRMLKLAADRSPVFAQRMPMVLNAYETLLQANAPDAERQAQQLAPYLTGVPSGTMLQQVTSSCIGVQLQNEFQKANFWDVMNSKAVISQIQRTGALPKQVFDKETRHAAAVCIRQEMAAIPQPSGYRGLFNKYASEENRFKRSFSIPEIQTDATISMLWHEVAAQTFLERFESFFQACVSIDEASSLLEVAENTIGVRQKANETITGRIIRRLKDVQSGIHNLPDERQLFDRVVTMAASLRVTQSDKALKLVRRECEMVLERENNFIRRAGLCLLQSMQFNGYNWIGFLRMLQPGADDMMHNPYAASNLPLLATVSSVLRLFENTLTNDNLLQSFTHYLRQDVNMAPYTAAVRKDQKAMAQYFPGMENSASLRAWLGN